MHAANIYRRSAAWIDHYFSSGTIAMDNDAFWYKDAIIYETHVRAFFDSNNDGIGDFKGMTAKLDYLEGLGINALWLLPFYPSPLRDDGYDIADYYNIHKDYGTLKDFKEFLKEAHKRGIRVITELVVNHTSSEHEWFQKARHAKPGSRARDYYVWSDTPEKYKDARIIFKDFESSNWSWDSVAQAYYWHRFYSHQPDLNFENPTVKKAIIRTLDFWFKMGVDGLRLDAVPYLYEQDGTNCENLPQTHQFLKELRAHIDANHANKMLLAEANQWPEDAAAYFGHGDECHMAFHFPLMPRMFMAVQMEDSFPIVDILKSTPQIPGSCEWAIFLRNHDELTLEMVTDEERDYMYRVYAKDPRARINVGIRRRLAPLLGNNRKKIELINALLLSLPGTPVLYYGDEIGMGDNYYLGDRNGVRTPMQWTPDRNAGFSQANPHQLYLPIIIDPEYHYEAVNVETQERNPSSLLWWMKRVIAMRKQHKALVRGSLDILLPSNNKVLAFTRSYRDETILIIVNLSRFTQVVELDLSKYEGYLPVEVFSLNEFPPIRSNQYILTLGPYIHHWLSLKRKSAPLTLVTEQELPPLTITGSPQSILRGDNKELLESKILPNYLKGCHWFGAKEKIIRSITITEDAQITLEDRTYHLLLLEMIYNEGIPELYLLPVLIRLKTAANRLLETLPEAIILSFLINGEEAILYDAVYDALFRSTILETMFKKKKLKGRQGVFFATLENNPKIQQNKNGAIASWPLKSAQRNSSIIYDNLFITKLYRRLDEGINPELEIVRKLTEHGRHDHFPPFCGAIEYRNQNGKSYTVALMQEFVENNGDAWRYTIDTVTSYFETVLSRRKELAKYAEPLPSLFDIDIANVPQLMQDLIGGVYLDMAALLGRRTGELHKALASIPDENFSPEPFSLLYQRSVCQAIQSHMRRIFLSLQSSIKKLPENIAKDAESLLGAQQRILKRVEKITAKKIGAMKIRIHGDYHLGQVLFTGKDFIIIDFEGEPARTLSERRLKHSPLRDVAGMIRSFHYAIYSELIRHSLIRTGDEEYLERWVEPWFRYASGAFLQEYLTTVNGAAFIPDKSEDLEMLLTIFLLEKAVYELGYELHHRPGWMTIPIRGINHVLKSTR